MNDPLLFVGKNPVHQDKKNVEGGYLLVEGEWFYKIAHFDHMDPFFMSIVSDSDHWLYIWSNGALAAGRKNADHALFPYYTDDKIKDSAETTGSKTILRVEPDESRFLWEPFSDRYAGAYRIERNLYKNIYGNKLIFEEINQDLQLAFRYAWMSSDRFGFIKKSTIINRAKKLVTVEALDGIQNILPSGVQQTFQNEFSTLVDAYKKNELESETGLGLFSLSSIPVDRAEPSEALRATTVWSAGIQAEQVLLSSRQLDGYRRGVPVNTENDIRALRGAYFINARFSLEAGGKRNWFFSADIDQDSAQVASLRNRLQAKDDLISEIETDIVNGTENLVRIIAKADGLQHSADRLTTSRHFSNVLFNVMRGGIFDDGYRIGKIDLLKYMAQVDKKYLAGHRKKLEDFGDELLHSDLIEKAGQSGDADFERLCYEYLPLSFSRRHGDPSRPWNKFSIDIRDKSGHKNLNYQGNWRDIFQNWEALALSYPEYIESMITRFVNASTADGYNPYRLTREGFDWEVMDPHDAWSYIGYWGDHQVVYLTKLLELSHRFHPGKLDALLNKNIFTYANVPYQIKSYDEILKDLHNTVDFDAQQDRKIKEEVSRSGEQAKYVRDVQDRMYYVNLVEKLLVPMLAKLSNFIPEAGIWLNTQRPEWNDANNALVGYGVSMVTLYYMRRHINFIKDLINSGSERDFHISAEVVQWLNKSVAVLDRFKGHLAGRFNNNDRKAMTDALGKAGSHYRMNLYNAGFSEKKEKLQTAQLVDFFNLLLAFIDHSIRANRRDDRLYHSYNLIRIDADKIRIRHLYEMLEGQVAVLSSGLIPPEETVDILGALRKSSLYREDQATYLLYPNRRLPRFIEKNNIPDSDAGRSELVQELLRNDNTDIVIRDATGGIHFNGDLRNAAILRDRLKKLDERYQPLVEKESGLIYEIYELLFDHQSFTGRSGTFFKYEGLGSTYWHMVSKLRLAVQECCYRAVDDDADQKIIEKIKRHYFEIKEGIGVNKSPDLYGAFPTDPYSHTPGHTGVQQPGMTGQVKEDILARWGELGINVVDGCIVFNPRILDADEFLPATSVFKYYDYAGRESELNVPVHSFVFTFIQVPVVYICANEDKVKIIRAGGEEIFYWTHKIDRQMSLSIFRRESTVTKIEVYIKKQI